MARRYVRDAKGRFASKGYSGQSGGRGARLKSGKGNTRAGGGTKVSGPSATGSRSGTIKAKKVSEGQQYARRVKAGKDVSAAKSSQKQEAWLKQTQKTLDSAPLAGNLTPKSKIQARIAAQAKASQAANASSYNRRLQSGRTKEAAAKYRTSGSKEKYSTIKNPAPENSAPFAVTGSTWQGRKNAAAGRVARNSGKNANTLTQKQIATELKKSVRTKNIQATRILQKMAAKDGHSGDIKSLTTRRQNSSNRWSMTNRGNNLAARRSRDLMLDRAPSDALVNAAVGAASRGRVSQRRLSAVLKASGVDYGSYNKAYDKALGKSKVSQAKRRKARK